MGVTGTYGIWTEAWKTFSQTVQCLSEVIPRVELEARKLGNVVEVLGKPLELVGHMDSALTAVVVVATRHTDSGMGPRFGKAKLAGAGGSKAVMISVEVQKVVSQELEHICSAVVDSMAEHCMVIVLVELTVALYSGPAVVKRVMLEEHKHSMQKTRVGLEVVMTVVDQPFLAT